MLLLYQNWNTVNAFPLNGGYHGDYYVIPVILIGNPHQILGYPSRSWSTLWCLHPDILLIQPWVPTQTQLCSEKPSLLAQVGRAPCLTHLGSRDRFMFLGFLDLNPDGELSTGWRWGWGGTVKPVPTQADSSSTESLNQVKRFIEISKTIPLVKPSFMGCSRGLQQIQQFGGLGYKGGRERSKQGQITEVCRQCEFSLALLYNPQYLVFSSFI